jgi:hypothetical protein
MAGTPKTGVLKNLSVCICEHCVFYAILSVEVRSGLLTYELLRSHLYFTCLNFCNLLIFNSYWQHHFFEVINGMELA